MSVREFMAWLEGFESSFSVDAGCLPNAEQWRAIKEKLSAVVEPSSATWQIRPETVDSIQRMKDAGHIKTT